MTLRAKKHLIDRASKHMEWAESAKKLVDSNLYDAHNTISSSYFPEIKNKFLNNVKRYEKLSAFCEKRAMQILKQL